MIAQVCLNPEYRQLYEYHRKEGAEGHDTRSAARRIFNERLYDYFLHAQFAGITYDSNHDRDLVIADVMKIEVDSDSQERMERDKVSLDFVKVFKALLGSSLSFVNVNATNENISDEFIDVIFEIHFASFTIQEQFFLKSKLPLTFDKDGLIATYIASRIKLGDGIRIDSDINWIGQSIRFKLIDELSRSTGNAVRKIELGFKYLICQFLYRKSISERTIRMRKNIVVTYNKGEAKDFNHKLLRWLSTKSRERFSLALEQNEALEFTRESSRYLTAQLDFALGDEAIGSDIHFFVDGFINACTPISVEFSIADCSK